MNWLTPKLDWSWIMLMPAEAPAGSPAPASVRRASCNRSSSTSTLPDSVSSLWPISALRRTSDTCAASALSRSVYSCVYPGDFDHSTIATPAATATAIPSSSITWRTAGMPSTVLRFIWPTGVAVDSMMVGLSMSGTQSFKRACS